MYGIGDQSNSSFSKVSDLDLSHDLEITIPHFAYTII